MWYFQASHDHYEIRNEDGKQFDVYQAVNATSAARMVDAMNAQARYEELISAFNLEAIFEENELDNL